MLDIWQLEATEEFKLEMGLLRFTQVPGRECLGKRAREAMWRPVASFCPKWSGLSERAQQPAQGLLLDLERRGQT